MSQDHLIQLYECRFARSPQSVVLLPGAGSKRRYYRLTDAQGDSVIGVCGTHVAENQAFVQLARKMRAEGLRVPELYAVSSDGMYYLQQDLGTVSLYDCIASCHKAGTWDAATQALLRQVMTDLPALQFRTARGLDFSVCYPVADFDQRSVMWDLNYFKYCFLKVAGIEIDEPALEQEFQRLTERLLEAGGTNTFMYRDFQSRNVMVCGNDLSVVPASARVASSLDRWPYYIDFQGGRRGPVFYDVASFLWQARAAYPDELRQELLAVYRQALQEYVHIDDALFADHLHVFVFFRLLQVLGAYGMLGLVGHKAMFLTSIAQALSEAVRCAADSALETSYPVLYGLLRQAQAQPRFQSWPSEGPLTVRVTSFSYKKGIPEDYSGNGGGFVFDCRAPHNPGRYAAYKQLTGLDQPVIEFLEQNGEITLYMEHVCGLVDPAVERYLQRGFTSLMVSFGCTGGQHRSVYCAEHLAHHLVEKYGVHVELWHREQGIRQDLGSAGAASSHLSL